MAVQLVITQEIESLFSKRRTKFRLGDTTPALDEAEMDNNAGAICRSEHVETISHLFILESSPTEATSTSIQALFNDHPSLTEIAL